MEYLREVQGPSVVLLPVSPRPSWRQGSPDCKISPLCLSLSSLLPSHTEYLTQHRLSTWSRGRAVIGSTHALPRQCQRHFIKQTKRLRAGDRKQHWSSMTEKIGESAKARPEASYRATLLFYTLAKRYRHFLPSPEPHLLGRTPVPFRTAAAAWCSLSSVASEWPALESGTWWSRGMFAAKSWS